MESVCLICGAKLAVSNRKTKNDFERKLELVLGYLMDIRTNTFNSLKSDVLMLVQQKTVGLCWKCEVEAEAILELHLELEKVQMLMIDKLEDVKKMVLDIDLEEATEDNLGRTIKDFQAAVKEKTSVQIPFVFLERCSFILNQSTTYLLIESPLKTEEPGSDLDRDPLQSLDDYDCNFDSSYPFEEPVSSPFEATDTKPYHELQEPCIKITRRRSNPSKLINQSWRRSLKTRNLLGGHKTTHSRYNCDHCSQAFSLKTRLDLHIRKRHGVAKVKCDDCGKEYNWEKDLHYHKVAAHGLVTKWRCGICGRCLASNAFLKRHVERCEANPDYHEDEGDHLIKRNQPKRDTPSKLREHNATHSRLSRYSCDQCDETFPLKTRLDLHIRKNHGLSKFMCNECEKQFNWEKDLHYHKVAAHGLVTKWRCEICGKCFASNAYFRRHIELKHSTESEFITEATESNLDGHEDEGDYLTVKRNQRRRDTPSKLREHETTHSRLSRYSCDQCDKTFPLKTSLAVHIRKNHGVTKCMCNECGKQYNWEKDLYYHMVVEHDLVTKWRCGICGKFLASNAFLRRHMDSKHSSEYKGGRGDTPSKLEASGNLLKTHLENETAQSRHCCDKCAEIFPLKIQLDAHIQKQHGVPKLKCSDCGKEYRWDKDLRHHMVNVHGLKTEWICQTCGTCHGTKAYLQRHIDLEHSTESKFICEECGKPFRIKKHYLLHRRSHAEKTHKCSYCDKAFTRPLHLTNHERLHTNEKPYACAHCGKTFAQQGGLWLHLKKCGQST